MRGNIILIYGKPKTGKTRLARLLATLTNATLVDLDSPDDTMKAVIAYVAYPTKPLIITMQESKVVDKTFPKGSPFIMSSVDIAIQMPRAIITWNRTA